MSKKTHVIKDFFYLPKPTLISASTKRIDNTCLTLKPLVLNWIGHDLRLDNSYEHGQES